MRSIRLSLAFIAAGAVLLGVPRGVRAQDRAALDAQPGACVAATGPDSGRAAPDSAMQRSPVPSPTAGDPSQRTTLRLVAAVQADEVRFEKQPKLCVTLSGDARLDSVRVVARRNLASPVVRGTTYRDVYVVVEILGRLNAECISARITGTTPAGQGGGVCASLGVRDSTAGRRSGAPPP